MQLPKPVNDIFNTFTHAGYEIYAVGGSVRDILLNRTTAGWDFTTNATPEKIQELFPDHIYENDFGTVGIKIYFDGKQTAENVKPDDIYEITTYRSETGYTDFRHPDSISWGKSLKEDLSRRDFTINAIAYDGKNFIDPYGGKEDLDKKIIRTVGQAGQRFTEDALRLMRAIRIASQLGFMIEEKTRQAISEHAHLLKNISIERIRDELMKILASQYAADGIMMLKSCGIIGVILPELDEAFKVDQKSPKRHHIYDVGTHSVMALKNCPSPDPIVRLATLLHDIGKPKTVKTDRENGVITFYNHEVIGAKIVRGITSRLRLSKRDSQKIYILVRWHQFSVDERQTDSAIRRIIRRIGTENLDDMIALRIGDRLGGGAQETSWRLELFKKRLIEVQKQPFSVTDLSIDGNDVMKEKKIKPGRAVGLYLNQIFKEVENGLIPNDRNVLLEKLRSMELPGLSPTDK